MGKVVKMGEHFSINLIFSDELDTTEALPYLFGDCLNGFFNPVSVFYGFVDKNGEYFKGVIGEELESLSFNSPKLEKEELVEDLYLTKYNGDVFLKNREVVPISNIKAGELNFSELTDRVSKFCNRYIEYLQTAEYTFGGEKYSKERNWIEEKLKSIQKFSGFA